MPNLREKLKEVPQRPGVYQFLDKDGKVIYVGKAKNLRSRVAQYFGKGDGRPQIPFLMNEAANFDYTIVNNELESLYLENTLIKQYHPKYNILLRDDKNYAFIRIDYSTRIPQIGYARKLDPKNKLAKYFGPYTAAYKIRNTLNLVRKIFPFCSAGKVSGRPCFYYYLHRCPGVCVGKITIDEYKRQLEKIAEFLNGDVSAIIRSINTAMKTAAAQKKFESAGRFRDQLRALQLLREKQTVILTKKVDWDLVSVASSGGYACVNLFKIREGKLFDKENFVYEMADPKLQINPKGPNSANSDDIPGFRPVLQRFSEQYYLETSQAPRELYLESPIDSESVVKKLFLDRFKKSIKISVPQKGKIKNLIKLGQTNAREYLKNWLADKAGNLDKINGALDELKNALNLPTRPERIECYDISNIQGANAAGSMAVFNKGLPAKSQYRKFKIRRKSTPDDFAMMREMLARRAAKTDWPLPNLMVIDGGKGQLSAALEALSTKHIALSSLAVIGLAKRIEEIFIPDKSAPIILPRNSPALQLLQRLRDEAHRFGITFHRQLRSKQAVRSALDDIRGVGPKTKKLLKAKFGAVANIRKASLDDLTAAVGEQIARTIQRSL